MMKPSNAVKLFTALLFVLLVAGGSATAQTDLHASDGIILFEAEDTRSDYGKWELKTEIPGSFGKGYLEFTGNTPVSGPPDSPLIYRFKITKPGLYFLHLHCAKEVVDGRSDLANDCYVRVEGEFGAGPKAGDKHGNDAPLELLRKDTKFYGGNPGQLIWQSGNRLDPGGHNNKRVAVYDFKAGEYTLVVSGRSQKFKLDRIAFRHKNSPPNTFETLPREEPVPLTLVTVPAKDGDGSVRIDGELKKWHKVTLVCSGPAAGETSDPNPFSDYRLDVSFTHPGSGETYVVPGYYAADGDAAETRADAGTVWHACFSPSQTGTWEYSVSFRTGRDVALDANPDAGKSAGFFDGKKGAFEIAASDRQAPDLRAKGRLQVVGKHHLRSAETGDYFLKVGVDAPENLLAYEDFDAVPNVKERKKSWVPHQQDFDPAEAGAYTWQDGKGSELMGAVSYLSDQGLNVFSFLTFSLDGDDDNVFPHRIMRSVGDYEKLPDDFRWQSKYSGVHHDRFDVSRLAQWERIFAFAQTRGMYLHFKTQETENELLMDGGELGRERKLYYRELIARFGHHLALNWNLGEENSDQTDAQRIAVARYIHNADPYDHLIVIHTYPNKQDQIYTPLLGDKSELTGASVQAGKEDFSDVFPMILKWVTRSAEAGKPWVVACDEPGDAQWALRPDEDPGASHVNGRKRVLWGTVMAGGAGVEWYFGYKRAHSDLTCQDFRSRHSFWPYCRHLLSFFRDNGVPFQEMTNMTTSSNEESWCMGQAGKVYVVYLQNGGSTRLDLSGAEGMFQVRWYDPRNGGPLQNGTVTSVTAGGPVELGNAPCDPQEDWAVLIRK